MKTSMIAAFVLMSVTGLALAQPPGMGRGPGAGMGPCNPETMPCGPGAGRRAAGGRFARMMKRLDTNGDGKISHAEHNAVVEKRFARFDTNGDGNVTKQEFIARSEGRFKKVDINGDGYITQDERRAMRRKFAGRRGWAGNNPQQMTPNAK